MPPEINPVQFGELVAHVENLRQKTADQDRKLDRIENKLDLLADSMATHKGEVGQQQRYNAGYITFAAALVSSIVAIAVDYFIGKHS
jgi:hypothetical protein